MVVQLNYKILSISDKVIDRLQTLDVKEEYSNIDLILACGDLPYYYIENVSNNFGLPTFFVRGNHDNLIEYSANGSREAPLGAIDLHKRVINFNNLIMVGFEGSVRYKLGPFMYTQNEMWMSVLRVVPKLIWNKLVVGRYFDILVTHAPAWGVHDKEDITHQGFKAFGWLIEKFKPSYHFHGHIHVYKNTTVKETVVGQTKVINTYGVCQSGITVGKKHYPQPVSRPIRPYLGSALEDFRIARNKAALQGVISQLTGKSINLLSFEQVRDQLHGTNPQKKGEKEIPLDAIIGSVGRFEDFTDKFFPKHKQGADRWANVKKVVENSPEIPSIDVYQIGEVYFVLDGNHRVSVARQRGDTHIKAKVTEIKTKVPITADLNPDDLIIKAQQVKFLEDTGLDELVPDNDFSVSSPGCYRKLRHHISSQHYFLSLSQQREIDFQEAVEYWLENTYKPVVRAIRENGMLRDFPDRTYTDLYLWLVDHQENLKELLGWEVEVEKVAMDIVERFSKLPDRLIGRWKKKIFSLYSLKQFDPGPIPLNPRPESYHPRMKDKLFSSCLVPITGGENSWSALDQALYIAKKESGVVRGLHIIRDGNGSNSQEIDRIKSIFYKRCEDEGIKGLFVVEKGDVAQTIISRARWNDLLVLGVSHVPEDQLLARFRSGLRTIIQACPRPILIIRDKSSLSRAILAYDGSDKANEALYMSAYFGKCWSLDLTVLSIIESSSSKVNPLGKAKEYLDLRDVKAQLQNNIGSPGKTLVEEAKSRNSDFIIMGGYGHRPVMEVILGSTVDYVLREFDKPVLICR